MAESKVAQLTRYRTGGYGAMVEDDNGPWVRADDVLALLAAAKRSLDWLASYAGEGALPVYHQMRAAVDKAEGRS